MKSRKSVILILFIFSLFMGITAVSVGLGAAFPALNRIAAPVLCPEGNIEFASRVYQPYPGKNVLTGNWSCVDPGSQAGRSLSTFSVGMVAGTVYGIGIFLILIGLIVLKGRRAAE
ncbi:MAG: hypothetical protein HS115_03550 [Spirochaetales bacterium]|nr:hypothetical protein [Spirochaetales bacterium]